MLWGPFAFRPAALGSRAANVATTFAQLIVFWTVLLGAVPLVLAYLENRWSLTIGFPPIFAVAGAVLLVLASAVGIWSAVTMSVRGDGTPLPVAMPTRLVVSGPYRFIRNPMAAAGITQGVAVGLLLSSWLVVGYALVGSLLWNYAIRPWEEADLESRFGTEYRRYREEVWCWVPRLPGLALRQKRRRTARISPGRG